ncbi:LPS ABC transporter substrate-binding protein LptA [Bradyrhizobium sp. WSM 1704]|uniref:LptA/OstA family protein n=1 Tax=Bradyrhizobium semiaridum TaxID=2821404 RepID=UPI001CE2E2AA|nr:LptA/OstA family protein [Bradyrhizobium semiaridum]MCA6125256.1 LPS ABC transporter substrate-binding protein LptA [Bradyrhizobium semiaridum]
MIRRRTMTMLLSRACAIAAVVFAPITFEQVYGQSAGSVPNAMQGFVQNRDQPVRIEAAVLEMRDKKKEATFSGNVKVVQGDTTMTSKVLVVFYEDKDKSAQPSAPAGSNKQAKGPVGAPTQAAPTQSGPTQAAPPGPGGASSIKRLEAKGSVVVTQRDQTVTGEIAIFDAKANLITVLGGGGVQVVLTQCNSVLRGDRLRVDMTTGVSRVDSESGTGKVTATTGGGGQDCGPSASAAPLPAQGKSR